MSKKHGTDEILCRKVPVGWCLNTTFGESQPVPGYCAQVLVRAPLKYYVHIGAWCPCPSTEPGHQVWRWPKSFYFILFAVLQEGTASVTVDSVTREIVKDDVILVSSGAK